MNVQPQNPPPPVTGVRRVLYVVLAFVFFVLGLIGIVLPGIPTTPFLLLMSFFLIRVSTRLHQRVLQWPLIGKPIRDWQEKGGVEPRIKVTAYVMVVALVALSLWLNPLGPIVQSVVVVAALIGIYVVYRLPTLSRETD